MRILALEEIGVQTGCKGVLAEVGKAQKRRKAHAAHTAHQGALLRV